MYTLGTTKNTINDAMSYFSSRMEDLNDEHQFYLDIILQYIDKIEHKNKELEDQVYYLKTKL
tara:strand:+ start:60 stop:245 length:186 start_codon:yes stop_codon:yes gene_type:complete